MPRSSVTILAYHRIATPGSSDISPTLIDAYPADFEAQMAYIAKRYNVVSFRDVVRALRQGYTLPRRAFVITFDDGYNCFRDTAMPILKRLGLPVTLFVPTGFTTAPGRLFWWDAIYSALSNTKLQEISLPGVRRLPLTTTAERLVAYEQLVTVIENQPEAEAERQLDKLLVTCQVEPNRTPYLLGWDDIRCLVAEGVTIGPHTRNHPILSQASPERVRDEVEGSWADLTAQVADPLPIFCYPNGLPHAVNRTARQAVKDAGLVGAVTMVAGLNVLGQVDPFLMHRIGATAGESLSHFRFKIGPGGRIYRRVKALATRKALPTFEV